MNDKFLLLTERGRLDIASSLPAESDILKLAGYFQNYADSTRNKILSALSMSNLCVNDLAKVLGINQTTISHSLRQLKDQNLVTYKREGKILIYGLASKNVNEIMLCAINAV